jgi:hypothetical protein
MSVVGLSQILFALGLDIIFSGPSLEPIAMAGIGLVLLPTAWMMAESGVRKQGSGIRSQKEAPSSDF